MLIVETAEGAEATSAHPLLLNSFRAITVTDTACTRFLTPISTYCFHYWAGTFESCSFCSVAAHVPESATVRSSQPSARRPFRIFHPCRRTLAAPAPTHLTSSYAPPTARAPANSETSRLQGGDCDGRRPRAALQHAGRSRLYVSVTQQPLG